MERFFSITIFILLFTNILFSNTVSDKKSIKILNIVNHQRMLSQQITKAYLYAGNKIAIDEAKKEIKKSLQDFQTSYKKINYLTKNQSIKQLMIFIAQSGNELNSLSKKPLNPENIKSILNLSESILNRSEDTILLLKKDIQHNDSEFITILGQQSMLAQRIAKYYIAYQSNRDEDIKKKMKKSIKLFDKNHKRLMKYQKDNSCVNKKLQEIDKLWSIVHKLYIDIEKGELPLIVFETTDNITNKMNELIKLCTLQIKEKK
jgi:arsenate reductase-like glutaredoxin family protein